MCDDRDSSSYTAAPPARARRPILVQVAARSSPLGDSRGAPATFFAPAQVPARVLRVPMTSLVTTTQLHQNTRPVVTKRMPAPTQTAPAPAPRAARYHSDRVRSAPLSRLQAPRMERLPHDAVYAPPTHSRAEPLALTQLAFVCASVLGGPTTAAGRTRTHTHTKARLVPLAVTYPGRSLHTGTDSY